MPITSLHHHSAQICSQFQGGGLFAHVLSHRLPRLTSYIRNDIHEFNRVDQVDQVISARDIIQDIHLLYYMYSELPIIDNPFHGILRSLAMVPLTDLFETLWNPRLAVAWASAITLDGFGRELGDLTPDQVLSCDSTSSMLMRRHQAINDFLGYTSITGDKPIPPIPASELLDLAIIGRLNPSQELQLIHSIPLLVESIQRSSITLSSSQILSLASHFPNVTYQLLSLLFEIQSPLWSTYIEALPDLALDLSSLDLVLRIVEGEGGIVKRDGGDGVDVKELVLRPYLANCVKRINKLSTLEDEDEIMGSTILLCHLITRLLDTHNLNPLDDLDTAEINEFLLSHSKYAVATVVYKRLLEDRQ